VRAAASGAVRIHTGRKPVEMENHHGTAQR
jgi:hypothetical protein